MTRAIYYCIQCDAELNNPNYGKPKYCSNKCQSDWRWANEQVPLIEAGQKQKIGYAIRRYVEERDGNECSECGLTEWRGKPITLDVDHIDGDIKNNMPGNFRLLCPNCHRQTPTWGNKKRILEM